MLGFKCLFSRAAPAAAALALLPLAVQADAPAPTKPVDLQRYAGRWYEVARVPNHFEKGRDCDGPTADYRRDAAGAVTVVQTCHQNSPTGPVKAYHARAEILDPGTNAKFRLTFFVVVAKEYWVLDHAQDYRWAIVGDPSGQYLWFFSRQAALPSTVKDALLARARALGYDTAKLEFPPQG